MAYAHAVSAPVPSSAVPSIVRVLERVPEGYLVAPLHTPGIPWQVRCALPPGAVARAGDELVVLRCQEGAVAIARVAGAGHGYQLTDGTQVRVDPHQSTIRVQRADGTPLFQYQAGAGQGTISLENESLRVHASRGDLSLSAAGQVRVAGQAIELAAAAPGHSSTLSLRSKRARLASEDLQLAGSTLTVEAKSAELRGEEVRTQHKRARVHAERLETVADVLLCSARNSYQAVQELLQQKVGSLRTLVSGTAQLNARTVSQRGAESYKIRSEKIHLG